MSDTSRRSSRQPLLSDDTTSLTSFPDLNASDDEVPPDRSSVRKSSDANHDPLNALLDRAGPSMFDDSRNGSATEAQTLSAASAEALQDIIGHRGALNLVRRLATLLAERDAHITALTRLTEEFKVPPERIADAAERVKRAEERRISLKTAFDDPVLPALTRDDESLRSVSLPLDGSGTVRGLTRLFGGGGSGNKQSREPNETIRAPSKARKRSERPQSIQSIDARSIQSQDSGTGWTANWFGTVRARKESQSVPPRQPLELVTQHDKAQLPPTLINDSKDPHEAQWNRFLVKVNESRAQDGDTDEFDATIGLPRFRLQGSAGQQKLRALTQLVLGGIPIRIRHPIWMDLSNTHTMLVPGGYEHYLSISPMTDSEQIEEIMKDVPRTLTTKYDFYSGRGHERLKKVLVAFVSRYEGLGYTQGLNTIAGYLLLAIPSEEDAFWAMCNIIENFFPPDYFSKSSHMYGPLADNIVLRQCIKEQLPQLNKHLDDLGIESDHTVPLSWFFTAFSTVLPQEVLMRVWDVWLCLPNLQTFTFNIALTLLSKNVTRLLECESEGEYRACLDDCSSLVGHEPEQINALIKQAFSLRKRLEHVQDRRIVEFKVLRRKRDSTEALYDT